MYKAFKYRLYPSESQKELIANHIGSCRFVYNLALETKKTAYQGSKHNYTAFDLINQLPGLKKDFPWLRDVNSQSFQQEIRDMNNAYKQFFNGAGFPKFKKKSEGGSFCVPQDVKVEHDLLKIPKFKKGIKMVLNRPTKGTIKRATVSRTPTGKYFVSILCDTGVNSPNKLPIEEPEAIGVNLGIKDFAVTSKGEVIENPKHLKNAQSKLKYLNRKYSKYKGKRAKHRLALQHETIANKRGDFLHKVSTKLVRENQTIALETLAVSNMIQNPNRAQAISDVSWSAFVDMLEYKAEWYGTNILRIDRFAPSTKTCSTCGSINKELTLKVRRWTCQGCNSNHDRDINAAMNIKSFALKNNSSGEYTHKNQDELPTLVGVPTPEAYPIGLAVGG